ncbi:MAG TPA: hypothetical protein DIT38_00120 [Burkholderiales bacterium]|nr:hypothetical protein [Burkholderiales bacterium]
MQIAMLRVLQAGVKHLRALGGESRRGLWAAKAAGAATGKTVDKCGSIRYLKDIYSENTA